jgi:hypothetical protein
MGAPTDIAMRQARRAIVCKRVAAVSSLQGLLMRIIPGAAGKSPHRLPAIPFVS